jgi:hypothetical protein
VSLLRLSLGLSTDFSAKIIRVYTFLVSILVTSLVHHSPQVSLPYICMYVCKGWAIKTGLCTATFNDLLCYPYSLTLY